MFRFTKKSFFIYYYNAMAILGVAFLVLVFVQMVLGSLPIFVSDSLTTVWGSNWNPYEDSYGLRPMIFATVVMALTSTAFAVVFGILISYSVVVALPSNLAKIQASVLELMSGIPSVVFGFWGLITVAPLLQKIESPGLSILLGTFILLLMILPTMTLLSISILENFYKENQASADALNISPASFFIRVFLPARRSKLASAGILSMARAIGETMAVLMVCGNIIQVPDSIFSPVRALTANIALEMAYALDDHRSALYLSGLVILIIVSLLLVFSLPVMRDKDAYS
ncbi:MAG: PstC family ABC transporter permease [Bdellovibrionales bacterium]